MAWGALMYKMKEEALIGKRGGRGGPRGQEMREVLYMYRELGLDSSRGI